MDPRDLDEDELCPFCLEIVCECNEDPEEDEFFFWDEEELHEF